MNKAASHLVTRRVLQGIVRNGRFLLEEGCGPEVSSKRKERIIFRLEHLFLWGWGWGGEQ